MTFEDARAAMLDELSTALLERECRRVEAAAVWLCSTGTPLVEVYETLVGAARREAPEYASTPADHVSQFELQECLRDLVARLAPASHDGRRGGVLVVVPGGSRWVLGTSALVHLLEDAGYEVLASPSVGLSDVEAVLETMRDPVALVLALHEVALLPQARELVRRLRTRWPQVCVVAGGHAHESVDDLAAIIGAHRSVRTLRETLDAVTGGNPLSPREMAVLTCVAAGMSNPDAGQHLGVAAATVKTHLDRVYAKLGTSDRTATVALAMRRGWLD